MTTNHVTEASVGFLFGDNGHCFFVAAFDPVFGDRLLVAKFEWDDGSPDAQHHRDEAERLANLLADTIGR